MKNDYPIASNEKERLTALRKLVSQESSVETGFDRLVTLAAKVCKVPIATIALVEEEVEHIKAGYGIDLLTLPRKEVFCNYTIQGDKVLVVEDAAIDLRFSDLPSVAGAPFVRFYAAAPLITSEGFCIGTFCVIDLVPRTINEEQILLLQVLAEQAVKIMEFQQKNAETERLNKLLQRISSITAHDIRSPLAALKNLVGMKKTANISRKEIEEVFPLVETQLSNTLGLLNNLVEWGKMQLAVTKVENQAFFLRDPVNECLKELELNAKLKKNRLENNVPDGILIESDENGLKFILRNLLNNAIKFTESGTISISYCFKDEHHFLWLKDTGIGIDLSQRETTNGHMILPRRKGTSNETGSGLGFLLIEEQLKKMNGEFCIESEPGMGTTVVLKLTPK